MIAVIFEVWPNPEHRQDYFDMAEELRSTLETIDGFISVERFTSLSEEGKVLSLSFWSDRDSVRRWRENLEHRMAQEAGRSVIFKDYRLRVASVLRDYGKFERNEAPDTQNET